MLHAPTGFIFVPHGGTCGNSTSLNPGATCTTAATVYTPINTGSKTWTLGIQVAPFGLFKQNVTTDIITANQETTVAINPNNDNEAQDIEAPVNGNPSTGTFIVKNTGSMAWLNASVTRAASDSSWLTLTTNTCSGTIAAGATCTVSYSATQPLVMQHQSLRYRKYHPHNTRFSDASTIDGVEEMRNICI